MCVYSPQWNYHPKKMAIVFYHPKKMDGVMQRKSKKNANVGP